MRGSELLLSVYRQILALFEDGETAYGPRTFPKAQASAPTALAA
ncbi:hypothetical protein ACIOWG_21745 [Streptomyces sp. NPDC087658]